MANNAKMIDANLYRQAGINPEMIHRPSCNGSVSISTPLRDNLFLQHELVDREIAATRYKWHNLPVGMSSQDLERLLYYKGNLCFFYMEELNQFFILPYALQGGIDVYGRFVSVHPIPLATTGADDAPEVKKQIKALQDMLTQLNLEVQYDVVLPEEIIEDPDRYLKNSCVLLKDYTNGLAQTITPRSNLQKPLLDVMSNIVPYLNTALMNSTGVSGVRVNNNDESASVMEASNAVYKASLNGNKWVPMKGALEFQDFATTPIGASQDFLLALQSLQNLELAFFGLENGGIYQKKEHMLQDEYQSNTGSPITALVYKDGLDIRQRFCDIVNSIWGIGLWCEPYTIDEMMDAMGQSTGDESMPTNEDEGGNDNDIQSE